MPGLVQAVAWSQGKVRHPMHEEPNSKFRTFVLRDARAF